MIPRNNPVGRLYHILDDVRNDHSEGRALNVWADIFRVDSDSYGDVLYHHGQLIQLVSEAKQAVIDSDLSQELYLKPFPKIESSFYIFSLNVGWNKFRENFDDVTMTSLGYCAEALSHYYSETIIEEDKLSEFQKQVEDLSASIFESDLDSDLKEILVDKLEMIRRSIVEYRIRGAEGLKRALEASIGTIMLHMDRFKDAKEKDKKWTQRFFGVIDKLQKLVSFALKAKELGGPVIKLLLSDASGDAT